MESPPPPKKKKLKIWSGLREKYFDTVQDQEYFKVLSKFLLPDLPFKKKFLNFQHGGVLSAFKARTRDDRGFEFRPVVTQQKKKQLQAEIFSIPAKRGQARLS